MTGVEGLAFPGQGGEAVDFNASDRGPHALGIRVHAEEAVFNPTL